jgi:hypothetical protein
LDKLLPFHFTASFVWQVKMIGFVFFLHQNSS